MGKDQVYVKGSGANTNDKTIKILTLQEKKNLLSAYLNDVKVEITKDEITKENFKKVFLTDPDNSYNSTGKEHAKASDSNKEEKIKDKLLEKYSSITDDSKQAVYKLFQINSDDVKDFDAFKKYVDENLSSDVFWTWVMDLAMASSVQDLALTDLGSKSDKIEVFDGKWANVGGDKFVRK